VGRHSDPVPEPGTRSRREARRAERRSAGTPRRRRALIAGGVAALLIATGGALWAGGVIAPPASPAAAEGCPERRAIVVVADPSIADAARQTAERLNADAEACLAAEVVAQDSADTAAALAAGSFTGDAWIPDSSVWVARLGALAQSFGRQAPVLDSQGSVAVSPVVLATPSATVDALPVEPSWAAVRDRTLTALLPDPEASAASLAALSAVQAVSAPEEPRQLAAAMLALGRVIPASADAAISSAAAGSVVVMSESEVARHNRDRPAQLLVANYPADGTVVLDYPFVRVPAAAGSGSADAIAAAHAETASGIVDFEAALRAESAPLLHAGLRRPDGSGTITTSGVSAELPFPDTVLETALAADSLGAGQLELLRQWGVMTLRSRMLAVIDVSGSMADPAGDGLRRIDLFQRAAGGALAQFSGEVQLGVWVFSTARDGERDWEELAPIAPLADAGHTAQVMGVVASLPDRLGGATGLYDTTLAAVDRVREGYDPKKMNSVLLITDGRNEDESGLGLDQLLSQLAERQDPERPVPVIMVGFGPDTDLEAMQRIAEVTGGAAYSATKPEDLGIVLVDALSQRACRPDCG